MPITRQPENYLYNDNPYQLPGPAPVLAPPGGLSPLGPQGPGENGQSGPLGPAVVAAESRSPREWLLFVIWRQKYLIAATVVLAGLLAAAYLARATPVYTSTARISVRPLVVNVGPPGSADSVVQPAGPNYLNAERENITGDNVLGIAATLQDVLLTEPMKSANDPIECLRGIVGAEVDRNSDQMLVSASCPNPQDAATIANGVVKAYQLYQTRSSTDQTSSIDKQLATLRDEEKAINERIAGQTQQLHDMELKWGVLSHQDDRNNIAFHRLQALSEALTTAQTDASEEKMAAEEASRTFGIQGGPQALQPGTAPASVDDDEIPVTTQRDLDVLRAEMMQAQTQLQELEQRYLPEHPAITNCRRKLGAMRRRYVAALQRRARASEEKVARFQAQYDAEQRKAVEVDAHAAEYNRVKDDQATERAKRDALAGQIHNIELSRALGELKVDEKERAKPTQRPTWPRPNRVMAVALAVGLSLGLLFACMREWVDDRFRTAGEIKNSLGMPLLAVIPQSTTRRSASVSGQRVLLDPASDTAEAYRSLRAAILYSAPEGQLRTLLVTSPCSGDGKTTLVSNLAIAMAQGGRKVLIVDADLRNPSQHDIFGVKNNTGLSALLAGRCSLETAIQRSHVQNLEVLPCGPTPANPAEILNSREFGETLETLADKYDCVVLDSPPVEAVADARIIAASCDATLIVLKAQTAHRRTTEHTRDSLTSVGARVLGVVVNDLPRRTTGGYGGRTAAARRYVPGLTNVAEPEVINGKGK